MLLSINDWWFPAVLQPAATPAGQPAIITLPFLPTARPPKRYPATVPHCLFASHMNVVQSTDITTSFPSLVVPPTLRFSVTQFTALQRHVINGQMPGMCKMHNHHYQMTNYVHVPASLPARQPDVAGVKTPPLYRVGD